MRRYLTAGLLSLCCASALAQQTQDTYPTKAVKVIVPYPAGQTTDLIARELGQQLSNRLGKAFFVDNRGGAGGIIGMEAAKRAEPDGYTLLVAASGPMAINPGLYPDLPYDVEKDYAAVALMATLPLFLVVRKDFPADTVQELVDYVKQRPGQLNYGSGGTGLTNHLSMEMFKNQTDLNLMHVPYRGASAALAGLIGGDVSVMFEAGPAIMPHVQSGTLKVLGVSSKVPSRAFPDIKPVAEQGVGAYDAQAWIALMAPAGTPDAIVQKLNAAMQESLQNPDVQRKLSSLGAETVTYSAQQTQGFIKNEIKVWGKAIKAANVTLN